MLLETAEDTIVNLEKVYEIHILQIGQRDCDVIATHHPGDDNYLMLYDGWTAADCRDYYAWLMNAIETAHPESRLIRNTFDAPSTKEEALARAQARASESECTNTP